jgi:hypothetical protein
MRRPSKDRSQKLSADSQRLVVLAQALIQAGSRLEERAWERHVDMLTEKLLRSDRQSAVDAALDHLFKAEPDAYNALIDSVEALSSSCSMEQDGRRFDALLIAVPILAWTRFSIASGPISDDALLTLSAQLYGHVLASDTRIAIVPTLFAIDQLPRSHVDVFELTRDIASAALVGTGPRAPVNLPETVPFLADTRFLLAAVVAPSGAPLFQWQTPELPVDMISAQKHALAQWQAQALPTIERLLPGCGVELLLPGAYYVACREADKQIRPTSIHAAVHYLTHTLNVTPDDLTAIIGGFTEESSSDRIDEYRISFEQCQQQIVVYGVVWPIYDEEEVEDSRSLDSATRPAGAARAIEASLANPLQAIFSALRQSGISDIKLHSEQFPMESCDDCGAPLYCDREAELVHAEMPEDAPRTTEHLH